MPECLEVWRAARCPCTHALRNNSTSSPTRVLNGVLHCAAPRHRHAAAWSTLAANHSCGPYSKSRSPECSMMYSTVLSPSTS